MLVGKSKKKSVELVTIAGFCFFLSFCIIIITTWLQSSDIQIQSRHPVGCHLGFFVIDGLRLKRLKSQQRLLVKCMLENEKEICFKK